jgi:hypothetical protein
MPYGKTPHGRISPCAWEPPEEAHPLPEPTGGRETGQDACETGYPAWLPAELRPARGVLVGLAIATAFWIVVTLVALVLL